MLVKRSIAFAVLHGLAMAAFLLFLGCSSNGNRPDGGQDQGDDPDVDSSDDGIGIDADLGDDFGLFVREGTLACSQNKVRVESPGTTLDNKVRITFKSGLHRLYRDLDRFDTAWIQQVEVGPAGEVATPAADGSFIREVEEVGEGKVYHYTFSQPFQTSRGALDLQFLASFVVRQGQVSERLVTVEDRTLDQGMGFDSTFELRVLREDVSTYFASCRLVAPECRVLKLAFQTGDRLKLESCQFCPLTNVICKEDEVVIRRAQFFHQGQEPLIEDFFHLAQSMVHHNWGTDLLVVIDPLVDSIGGLYLHAEDEGYPSAQSFQEASYLGGQLQTLQKTGVTEFEILQDW